MAIAFVFPGQGSQSVGMGKDLAENFSEARFVFEEVDAALSQNLSHIMWEGPEAELTLTENAQPALMAVSMAVLKVLEARHELSLAKSTQFVAGHSLGEYSAYAAAGTFSIADAARLLKIRGKAMQAATPVGIGAMAAVLGLDFDGVAAAALEGSLGEVCQVANDNSDGQVVISGEKSAVERAGEIAKAKGAKRVVMLPVSAPFHCALMQPAADAMREALQDAKARMNSPVVPVIANVVAAPVIAVDDIINRLVEQVTGTVRWRECVSYMTAQGITTFVEIGSGKVLTGLAKKNAPEAKALAIGVSGDFSNALSVLKG
jgi:[acyl-carrier-protein] S-malonyltransferase